MKPKSDLIGNRNDFHLPLHDLKEKDWGGEAKNEDEEMKKGMEAVCTHLVVLLPLEEAPYARLAQDKPLKDLLSSLLPLIVVHSPKLALSAHPLLFPSLPHKHEVLNSDSGFLWPVLCVLFKLEQTGARAIFLLCLTPPLL